MSDFRFPKSARLLRSKEFHRLAKYGKSREGDYLAISLLTDEKISSGARLGITVSKKFGKANKRNRLKRQIREAFRLQRSSIPKNILLHIRPQKKGICVKTSFLQEEIIKLFLKTC